MRFPGVGGVRVGDEGRMDWEGAQRIFVGMMVPKF